VGHAPNRTRKCATTVGSLGNEPIGRARYYAGGFLIMSHWRTRPATITRRCGAAEPEPQLTVSPLSVRVLMPFGVRRRALPVFKPQVSENGSELGASSRRRAEFSSNGPESP